MKHFYLATALNLIFIVTTFAQVKAPYTFLKTGQITVKDLKMTRYDADTSAGAVILYDGGKTRFSPNAVHGFTLSHERHVIIKILKKSGYNAADVTFPLYFGEGWSENLQNLTGFTYNLVNDKIVTDKLGKDAIFEEKTHPAYNTQKFTMPNIKEGSVLEFTYRVQTPILDGFKPWNFQHHLPVAWSEYCTEIPDVFTYQQMVQGYESFAATETKNITVNINLKNGPQGFKGQETRYVMQDVPALREEAFLGDITNYQSRIDFALTNVSYRDYHFDLKNNTWEKISELLLKNDNFGFYFSRTGFAAEYLPAITKGLTEPEQKLDAIFTYVKNQVTFNDMTGIWPKQPLRKTLETRKASAAEINLLLLCFLREAGFETNPVLISTRGNGLVTSVSSPNQYKFNYLIVHARLGDKVYLLDATEPLAGLNVLPARCLNGEGLLLSATPHWVDLRIATPARQVYYTKAEFSKDLSLKCKMQVSSTGYAAFNQRKELSAVGEKKFIDDLVSNSENWEIENYTVQPGKNLAEALKMDLNFTVPAQSPNAATIYLQPILNQSYKQNPLRSDTRKFPLDFTVPFEETFVYSYTIPEGYRIDEQPKNAIATLPENGGKHVYSITASGNTINVISKISIERPIFASEEYPYLKEFFNHILAKQAEQIVLKKIN